MGGRGANLGNSNKMKVAKEIARQYIKKQGGFEKFAEWGLF